jgi:DNA repair exonuclease SbcCD ATPase subunit
VSEMSLATIEIELSHLKTKYQTESGKLELLQTQLAGKETELKQVQHNIEIGQKVKIMLGQMSELARERMIHRIQETVTMALQAILQRTDISYKVEMWFDNSGKPNARGTIVSPCGEVMIQTEPEEGNGGGVTDVVSLALRAALLELSNPRPAGLFALDEPGKMISKEYLPNVAEFFKRYLGQTGRQGLIITHHDILADCADAGYQVSQENGISEVTEV